MIKKTVTYKDFNENEVTEDLYFHLSEADLIDWFSEREEDLVSTMLNIIRTEDPKQIVAMVRLIIKKSFGIKSPDGKAFIKADEATKNFEYTPAFSEIYTELATNTAAFNEFINGIIPEKYRGENNEDGLLSFVNNLPEDSMTEEEKLELVEKIKS